MLLDKVSNHQKYKMRLVAILSLVGLIIFSGCQGECPSLSPERIDKGAFQVLLDHVYVCSSPGLVVERIEVWPSIGGGVRKEGTTPSQPYRSLRFALTVRNEGEAADLRIDSPEKTLDSVSAGRPKDAQ